MSRPGAIRLPCDATLRAVRVGIGNSQHYRVVFRPDFGPIVLRRSGIGPHSPELSGSVTIVHPERSEGSFVIVRKVISTRG